MKWVSVVERSVPWSAEVMLKTKDGWHGKGICLEYDDTIVPCRVSDDGEFAKLLSEVTHWRWLESGNEAKHDEEKPRLSLVPLQGIFDVAQVREYGLKNYDNCDSWCMVEPIRYIDALYRHLLAMIDDMYSVDEESGIEHYKHIACNAMFLCELLKEE